MARNLPRDTLFMGDIVADPNSKNILKVSGESMEAIFSTTRLPKRRDDWNDNVAYVAAEDLFDTLDLAVFGFIKKNVFTQFQKSSDWVRYFQLIEYGWRPVSIENFMFFRSLGRGGFGLVKACKHKQTGKMFAAKMMDKRRIKKVDSADLILEELAVLKVVDSPYIVCLKYAFATDSDVYLVLDLMTGGDLGYHIVRRGKFTPEETRFYAARLVLALGAIHDLDIVYRDIKPENILLDELGYSRLSDFGLASRMRKNGLGEACGTRGYWAPEMLQRDADGRKVRYFHAVDWFSLGVLIYEFIVGVSPFRTDRARAWGADGKRTKEECMDLATLEMDPEFNNQFEEAEKDIIAKLMDKEPRRRLGSGGYLEVLRHPYFKELDWQHMEQVRPPYRYST
jgi:beta-adrenergic-receptor kinase